jgi:hypothetical protein
MEPTTPTVANNKPKVAIIVIVILVVAAIAIYMSLRSKAVTTITPIANEEVQVNDGTTPSTTDDTGVLTQEITSATTFDNEGDLTAIDKAF